VQYPDSGRQDARMSWSIEAVREAPVAPSAVFALYADPDTWSRWGHNATWARADGPLVEGGTVDVRANYGKVYPCRIRRLTPDRALELVVRPPGMTIVNVYEVEPTPAGGSRIRHAFQIDGPMGAFARVIGLGRVYAKKLEAEVEAVARMAATGSAGDSGATDVTAAERALHGAERRVGRGSWED
jgi:uncharacterized protein YndB with AHSA1/START domain